MRKEDFVYEHPEEYSENPEKYEEKVKKKKPFRIEKTEDKVEDKKEMSSFNVFRLLSSLITLILILFAIGLVLPEIEKVSEGILSDYPEEDRESYYNLRKLVPMLLIAGFLIFIVQAFVRV